MFVTYVVSVPLHSCS